MGMPLRKAMNRPPTERAPSLDAPLPSTRDLADLARAGYEIMQQPYTRLDFEIHHTADRPGYMRDNILVNSQAVLPAQEGMATSMVVETLVSAANGVGLVIRTNTGADLPSPTRFSQDGSAAQILIDEPTRRVFSGTGLPNPTFRLESAVEYEGIISVEPAPRSIKFYHSIAVRDLAREISRIAVDVAHTPLLYIQAPAQLPAQSYIGQDVRSFKVTAARRSSSIAVRFSIAMEKPSARLRFQLTDILTRYCSERGFGLWLADTRMGYRSGNWFQICPHADDLSRRERREREASVDSRTVEACLPITFVGPARLGSTHSIISFLCQFSDIGVASCSSITLHDMDFIHLQLSVSGIKRSSLRELNSLLAEYDYSHANPSDVLVHIHDALTGTRRESPNHELTGELSSNAGDYQTLVGPMLAFTAPDTKKRIAVWFTWQMEGIGEDLTIPVIELFWSFSDIGLGPDDSTAEAAQTTPNLEYLICRDVGNWVLRGRGKLSIPEADVLELFGGPDVETAAARLCVSLEQAWKASLQRRGAHGVRELTVAWREWWLGHWASLIS
jgi:hypothetical protein